MGVLSPLVLLVEFDRHVYELFVGEPFVRGKYAAVCTFVVVIHKGVEDQLPELVDYCDLADLIVLVDLSSSRWVLPRVLFDVHLAIDCQVLRDPSVMRFTVVGAAVLGPSKSSKS